MNIHDLTRSLVAFADDTTDLDLTRGELIVQIDDELIEATVEETGGTLYVTEAGHRTPAYFWIVNRIARIPLLADRILTHTAPEPHFVTPSGTLQNYLDQPSPDKERVDNLPDRMPELLSRKPATSSVLYVTSDAGEGKTTLINEVARAQARKYQQKKNNWLLVPISLGGRAFMTFDDIVVAELVNRFRFHLFHYQAFLEMVRLGVLVPAFDGFEEMFVAGSSGEALSALGNLLTDLESSGSVLVAARIAYFHYRNFEVQARLFDSIKSASVDFAQLNLLRWDRARFLTYSRRRGLSDGRRVYEQVRSCLGTEDHPVLTRPVLVSRLLDVAADNGLPNLLTHLHADRDDYFHQFVANIVERESSHKWIDQNTPHQPLLTTNEHHNLLAELAREMWETASDALRGDHLDIVADMYVDDLGKPPLIKRQIMQRVRHHALISRAPGRDIYAFDHDDFRRFYLGLSLATILRESSQHLVSFLEKGELPAVTVDSALNAVKRAAGDLNMTLALLQSLGELTASASYVTDNVGALVVRLLEKWDCEEAAEVSGLTFPLDALKGRRFGQVIFKGCHFQTTALEGTLVDGCDFLGCTFDQLDLSEASDVAGAVLDNCDVVYLMTAAGYVREPERIRHALMEAGFKVTGIAEAPVVAVAPSEPDEETKIAESALRIFLRATQVNEDVFRKRLGERTNAFFDTVLPQMKDRNVLAETPYRGGGAQRRYKLCVPMSNIGDAIPIPRGVASLDEFLDVVVSGD